MQLIVNPGVPIELSTAISQCLQPNEGMRVVLAAARKLEVLVTNVPLVAVRAFASSVLPGQEADLKVNNGLIACVKLLASADYRLACLCILWLLKSVHATLFRAGMSGQDTAGGEEGIFLCLEMGQRLLANLSSDRLQLGMLERATIGTGNCTKEWMD